MTEEEKTNLVKKINTSLAIVSTETRRQILWDMLRESITEDMEGIKWLYTQLHEFLKDEFGE